MDIIFLENSELSAAVCTLGAELRSLKPKKTGLEYIWQRDAKYWEDSAPVMFPICGRLFNLQHEYKGKTYPMPLHGLLWKTDLKVLNKAADSVTFLFESNDETRKYYPYEFRLELTEKLVGNKFVTVFKVNATDGDIVFSYGTHPGFNMPLEKGHTYEDYYVEFAEKCAPKQIVFSDKGYVLPGSPELELKDEKVMPLRRKLFETEAVFVRGAGTGLSICRDGKKLVTMRYPQCHVTGFWTSCAGEAPFLCVEAMHGSPDPDGAHCVLETKADMIRLGSGETYETEVEIEVVQ